MAKYVVANCATTDEAQTNINNLLDDGFPRTSITLITGQENNAWAEGMGFSVDNGMQHVHQDDEGLWQRIKEFFGAEPENDILASYRDDINGGNVLVVVDDALLPDNLRSMVADKDIGYWNRSEERTAPETAADKAQTVDTDTDTIQLEEERMSVNKENVEAGEVVLHKRVVEETQTVNVPLRHEEVVIERRPVNEARAADGDFGDETVTIPLWEEQAHVTTEPVVAEEVYVHKNDVEATQQFSANLRKEKLDVDKQGNVILSDENTAPPAP